MKPILLFTALFITTAASAQQKTNKLSLKSGSDQDTLRAIKQNNDGSMTYYKKFGNKIDSIIQYPNHNNMPIAISDSTTKYHLKMIDKYKSKTSL